MSDIYLDVPVSREKKKCSRVVEFCFTQLLFCYMNSGMYFCDTDCNVGPESANSMLSLKYPQEGMFIVSCWSLREAGPVCLERCVLVDECLSSCFSHFSSGCFFILYRRYFIFRLASYPVTRIELVTSFSQ